MDVSMYVGVSVSLLAVKNFEDPLVRGPSAVTNGWVHFLL